MALADLTDPSAVEAAIEEFEALGRDDFLAKYGFGKGRWMLVRDGKAYDSKAIVGAAYGFEHPAEGPLKWEDFSGGFNTTVAKLRSLGFDVENPGAGSNGASASFAFTAADCALFEKYPKKLPFKDPDVPENDRAKFKNIWTRLKGLGTWLADNADVGVPLKPYTSLYSQNGRSPRDLWCCGFPASVPNKSYGLQVALIISANGAEVCFCLGAGTSSLKGDDAANAKAALDDAKQSLKACPKEIRQKIEARMKPEWNLRRHWRAGAGTADFANLSEWLMHAGSVGGDEASISRDLTVGQLDALGAGIGDELSEMAEAFGPLLEYVYGGGIGSAIQRALDEFEIEADQSDLAKVRERLAFHQERFEELFGSPAKVDALTAEAFFGFLNDLDTHVSGDTGIFTLGPGLPAPKNPELPTWKSLVEDLDKLRAAIKQLLHGDPQNDVAARIDLMLAGDRPRRYITTQLALPTMLLTLAHPDSSSGVLRIPLKCRKLFEMGLYSAVAPETATWGEKFVVSEKALTDLPAAYGKDWDLAMRLGFYFSEAFERHFEDKSEDSPGDESEAGAASKSLADVADAMYVPQAFLQRIVAMLQEKRQVIFFGPPGTGKTYIAKALIKHLAPEEEQREIVQLHPSYTYEDFVMGFRPFLTDDKTLAYELHRGPLVRIAGRALANPGKTFVLLVDEINRGNLPRIFGELLYLLEYRDERISLMYSDSAASEGPHDPIDGDGRFTLPDNLWLIGTMNTADRSIGLIDAALRRRFHFVPFFPQEGPLEGLLGRWLEDTQAPEMLVVADWVNTLNALLTERFGRHLQVGHSYFMQPTLEEADVAGIWENDILPFLEDQLLEQSADLAKFSLAAVKKAAAGGTALREDQPASEDEAEDEAVFADDSAP